jgi:hypothetical protein
MVRITDGSSFMVFWMEVELKSDVLLEERMLGVVWWWRDDLKWREHYLY